MFKGRNILIVTAVCLAILLGTMAWMTVTTVRLHTATVKARHDAELERVVQLGLWRIDSALAALLAEENARAAWAFSSAAPVASFRPNYVEAYFRVDADGGLRLADAPPAVQRWFQRNADHLQPADLLAGLPAPVGWLADNSKIARAAPTDVGFAQRSQVVMRNRNVAALAQEMSPTDQRAARQLVRVGYFVPRWIDGHLMLLRRAERGEDTAVEGCLLDWSELRRELVENIDDLLPEARLVPLTNEDDHQPQSVNNARRLAALPVRLEPGVEAIPAPTEWSAIVLPLAIAWAGVILAVAAVVALVLGAARLTDRRAAFVGAVTHELRTPLTTLRMYAEMLQADMIPAEQRREYLLTLQREAGRLSQLVENVLAYARLEHRLKRPAAVDFTASELLARVRPRLQERTDEAGALLAVDLDASVRGLSLCTDPEAVEQILFNLVDNACKHGAAADLPRVELSARSDRGALLIAVRDHGPGIQPELRRRLFRPFAKSASEAAETAPGVGLGLALSRRLARQLSGDLTLQEQESDSQDAGGTSISGACFLLRLPLRADR